MDVFLHVKYTLVICMYCENRFVLPVLPIALMFSGYCLASMEKHTCPPDAKMKNKDGAAVSEKSGNRSKLKFAIIFLLLTNVPMAVYMTSVHQVIFLFPFHYSLFHCDISKSVCIFKNLTNRRSPHSRWQFKWSDISTVWLWNYFCCKISILLIFCIYKNVMFVVLSERNRGCDAVSFKGGA
jgi:Alg9-like mannosyltransferase family